MNKFLIVILTIILTACGGGSTEPESQVSVIKPEPIKDAFFGATLSGGVTDILGSMGSLINIEISDAGLFSGNTRFISGETWGGII